MAPPAWDRDALSGGGDGGGDGGGAGRTNVVHVMASDSGTSSGRVGETGEISQERWGGVGIVF